MNAAKAILIAVALSFGAAAAGYFIPDLINRLISNTSNQGRPQLIKFTKDGGAPFPVIGSQWSEWDWQPIIREHGFDIKCVDPVTGETGSVEDHAKYLEGEKLECAYGAWNGNEMIAQVQDGTGPTQWHYWWCSRTVDPHEAYVLMRRWYAANLPKGICQVSGVPDPGTGFERKH